MIARNNFNIQSDHRTSYVKIMMTKVSALISLVSFKKLEELFDRYLEILK